MTRDEILPYISNLESLQNVPAEQLQWLVDNSEVKHFDAGDFLFKKSWDADYLYIVLEGKFRIYIEQAGNQRELTPVPAGSVTGLLPYSRMKQANGFSQAIEPSQVLCFHRDKFPELIRNNYELTEALVHLMTSRVREFTALQQQNEKMMALGKLSAGLAHELNNPSAAIIRSAQELKRNLKSTPESFKKVMLLQVSPEQVDQINNLLFDRLSAMPEKLTLMQRSECEDDMSCWMEDQNVDDAMEIASNIIDFGFNTDHLQTIYKVVGPEAFPVVIGWINNNLVTEKLVSEIEMASVRIADLVGSVKSYSHMDRAPDKQKADVHEGIKNTLTLLNHKLKKNGIKLNLKFDESLPQANIMVSELNQVWTNLIDNAIDAIGEKAGGELSIETELCDNNVHVSIEDNGSGIPKEIQSKIFDPFFTTKEVGKGTGLGLEITRRIVNQHQGSILVESEPGNTVFEVILPVG